MKPEMPLAGEPPTDLAALADDIEYHLFALFLDRWYPRCVSERGGFHQVFAEDWTALPGEDRGVVFQARMTWTAAAIASSYSEKAHFLEFASHGTEFLTGRQWDPEHGGFLWTVDPSGAPVEPDGRFKRTYGQAFGTFALAKAGQVLPEANAAAVKGFDWLEEHAYDRIHGGWTEVLNRDGGAIRPGDPNADAKDFGPVAQYGLKLQNTHLHMVEALTELVSGSKHERALERLAEAVEIMLVKMYVEPGCFHTTFLPNWMPVPAAWSIAHDVEAAHLLLTANRYLANPKVPQVARCVVAHALDRGFDWKRGGFYESADACGRVWDRTKGWWNQFECLLGLAAVLRLDPENGQIKEALAKTWGWIRDRQFDRVHGGVFAQISDSGEVFPDRRKGHAWKAAYHETRAMVETAQILRTNLCGLPR